MTKYLAAAFAFSGLIAALVAARYWLKSSQLKLPEPTQTFSAGQDQLMPMLMVTQHVLIASARLNAIAAKLTGVAAVLSAASAVIGLAW